MKKSILMGIISALIVLLALNVLLLSLTFYFNKRDELRKANMGERYDSNKILVSENGSIKHKERLFKLFDKYSAAAGETEFVVHEKTAIAIAEAVMRELYPDDYYGVVYLPTYFQPLYYKAENCWEVWLHKNALGTTLSTDEQKSNEVAFVYIDVNTAAVRAIIPSTEFSVHNPANS